MGCLKVVIGKDLDNKDVVLNLDASMLIKGSIARGKTNTVYNILDSVLKDGDVVVDIIDLKGTEYNHYSSNKVNIVTDINNVDALLSDIIDELYYRKSLCVDNGCISIDNYNKLGKGVLPKRLLVIDELNYISDSYNKSLYNKLVHIYSCCRIFGIYVIATSHLDRVDTNIMSNSSHILEFPNTFNGYLTKKLYGGDIINTEVYKLGNGVLVSKGEFKVVKTTLNKTLVY